MSYNPLEPRRFGIELEVSRRLTNVAYADKNYSAEWRQLQEIIANLSRTGQTSPGWKLKVDTSCGGEIVSPILFGTKGLAETALTCSAIREVGKKSGKVAVDGECGLHIHFDASDITPQQLSRILILLHKFEPIIYAMYPRRNMEYCAPISLNMKLASRFRDWIDVRDVWYRGSNNIRKPEHFYDDRFINNNSQAGEAYDGTRYHGFNIHCYWRQQTIEYRYGPGSLNPVEIAAYYEMCLAITNAGIHGAIKPYNDIITHKYRDIQNLYMAPSRFRSYITSFFDTLRISRKTRKYIISKIRDSRPDLLAKAWSRKYRSAVKGINGDNKPSYYYKDINSGVIYSWNGSDVSTQATIIPGDAIVSVVWNGERFMSADPRFSLDFVLRPRASAPQPGGGLGTFFTTAAAAQTPIVASIDDEMA
jgi:hypothetical protein